MNFKRLLTFFLVVGSSLILLKKPLQFQTLDALDFQLTFLKCNSILFPFRSSPSSSSPMKSMIVQIISKPSDHSSRRTSGHEPRMFRLLAWADRTLSDWTCRIWAASWISWPQNDETLGTESSCLLIKRVASMLNGFIASAIWLRGRSFFQHIRFPWTNESTKIALNRIRATKRFAITNFPRLRESNQVSWYLFVTLSTKIAELDEDVWFYIVGVTASDGLKLSVQSMVSYFSYSRSCMSTKNSSRT